MINTWTGFSEDFITSCGFNKDFDPCTYPMYKYNIQKSKWTGFDNLHYVGCNHARTHRDSPGYGNYGAFLVVRNDGLIAKNTNCSKNEMIPQVPGTIVVLKLNSLHHVIRDNRLELKPESYWISVSFSYDDKMSQEEINIKFKNFLSFHKSHNCVTV